MRLERGKKGFMAIKIDLEKVYNHLKWSFVENTLCDIGILSTLLKLIMFRITTKTFQVF